MFRWFRWFCFDVSGVSLRWFRFDGFVSVFRVFTVDQVPFINGDIFYHFRDFFGDFFSDFFSNFCSDFFSDFFSDFLGTFLAYSSCTFTDY